MSASVEGPPGAAPPSPPGFPPETFRANLYVHHSDGRIEWYALLPASFARGPLVLGRELDCAINIDDGATSGHHAWIGARGPALWLTDLGSTNGTSLDHSRLRPERPIRLSDGAVIGVGNADIHFLYSRRSSTIRLVAEFIGGPLAGTRKVTEGPSTTIGREAELALTGPGVATHHLRVDAYDAEHIYLVPLDPGARTRVHGDPLGGITPISGGAELTVGPHRFRLRVETAPEAPPTAVVPGAPPRIDAAMMEARLQGRDPRAFDNRTIMDLSPLGAMVAKVLAGEVPPPPSAVRPPVRRPRDVPTLARGDALELARRTGPLPAARPSSPGWARFMAVGLLLVAVVAVAGLFPVPRVHQASVLLETGELRDIRAPVRGRLMGRLVEAGERVRAGDPLARLADGAIEAALERLSHGIGALEVYAGEGRVGRDTLRRAEDEAAAAERTLAAATKPASGAPDADALLDLRRELHERRGRLEALRARRADERAGPEDAAGEIGRQVRRRESLRKRLVITLESPVDGRVEAPGAPPAAPGAEVEVGRSLYRLIPLDPLVVRLDGRAPRVAAIVESAGRRATATVGGQRLEIELQPDAAGIYLGKVPDPGGRLSPGAPVELRIEGRAGNVLSWLLDQT